MRFKSATIPIFITISLAVAFLYATKLISGQSMLDKTFSGFHGSKSIPYNSVTLKNPSFEDFNFTQYTEGGKQKKFTIEGKKIFTESKDMGILTLKTGAAKIVRINDVRITFYEDNLPVSFISAKKAVLNQISGKDDNVGAMMSKIDLYGNINVMTGGRRTLACNNLSVDNKNNIMSAGGNCTIRYEGNIVKADYIDTDVRLKDFSFRNDTNKRFKSLAKIFKTI